MEDWIIAGDLASRAELVALAVLVLGFIVARLASLAIGRALAALDRRVARMTTSDSSVLSPRAIKILRAIVFWRVLFLATAFARRVLGIGGISTLSVVVISFRRPAR